MQTVYNDEIGGRLAEAMMMLEMAGEADSLPEEFSADELLWAAHSIIQSVRAFYTDGTALPLSEEAANISARIKTATAIINAKGG